MPTSRKSSAPNGKRTASKKQYNVYKSHGPRSSGSKSAKKQCRKSALPKNFKDISTPCSRSLEQRVKKPYRNRRLPSARSLRKAGLPQPITVSPTELAKLQQKWYTKLADDGFDDIELLNGRPHYNPNYLRNHGGYSRVWKPENAQFYRLLQNFLTHYQFRRLKRNTLATRPRTPRCHYLADKYILNGLNKGTAYREMLGVLHKRFKVRKSLFWLFYYAQALAEEMLLWNKYSPNGLLNNANADAWASDVLLRDMQLEAPNGLKLDPSWWQDNAAEWAKDGH